MMLCGMDYPVKPDNDRRKRVLDNDRERECRIMTVRKLNRIDDRGRWIMTGSINRRVITAKNF